MRPRRRAGPEPCRHECGLDACTRAAPPAVRQLCPPVLAQKQIGGCGAVLEAPLFSVTVPQRCGCGFDALPFPFSTAREAPKYSSLRASPASTAFVPAALRCQTPIRPLVINPGAFFAAPGLLLLLAFYSGISRHLPRCCIHLLRLSYNPAPPYARIHVHNTSAM